VGDAFNGTNFSDSPTFFSSMRLSVLGATVDFEGADFWWKDGQRSFLGYDWGSWKIAPTTISFEEIESAKSDIADWWTQYRAGMTAQDYRIQQLSHKIAWMVQHPITACEGANMAVYTASAYLLPGAGPLVATAQDGALLR
jgi:hypothetical protein